MRISSQWTKARYLTYTQLSHRPARAGADQGRRDRAQIDAAELLARRALRDRARGLHRHVAWRRGRCCAATGPTRCACCATRWTALVKISGSSGLMDEQPGAALLARRARHLVACGDELGRAGGEFRAHGVRARPQSGLSDVLTDVRRSYLGRAKPRSGPCIRRMPRRIPKTRARRFAPWPTATTRRDYAAGCARRSSCTAASRRARPRRRIWR